MSLKPVAARGPNADDIARGARFYSIIDWKSPDPGTIFDASTEAELWRYTIHSQWPRVFPLSLIFKPDFIVRSPTGQEAARIHHLGGIPPRFAIIQSGQTVGKIIYRNVLRTRSTLEFAGGPTWNFRQPLFTIFFYGDSDAGQQLWIMVGPSKRQWNMLLPPGTEDVYLPAALAFLHREYWRH